MALISRFGASAGLIAALSMVSTPALAADLPQGMVKQDAQGSAVFADFDTTTFDSDTDVSEWRGRGWRHGWRRHRRVDAGDVLAGVLIIGGIAAIADAANKRDRRERVRDRDYDRDYDRRYDRRNDPRYDRRDDRRTYRNNGSSGLESAADQCVAEIERNVRVESVDGVDRTAQGWIVTGEIFNGSKFTCAIDNDGRIDAIEYDNFRGASYDADGGERRADGQWDDQRYADARRSMGGLQPYRVGATYDVDGRGNASTAGNPDARPAYPGGPLPGEEFPDE